jgi:hypothetical protein
VKEAFEGEMNSYLENSQVDERGNDTTMDKFETLREGIKASATLILEPVKRTRHQKGWFLTNFKHLEHLANIRRKLIRQLFRQEMKK